MLWFKKRSQVEQMHDTRVEVVVHQQATQDVVNEALDANKHLLTALRPNHITLKLFVAAGGKVNGANK
jgi:hypothetical protein